MEKKIKIIILVLVILLIALGSTMAYAYFFTDYLKSDKEAFFKYILKNEELIDNLKDEDFSKYIEKQKNTAYSNSGEITISSGTDETFKELGSPSEDMKLTFKGTRDDNSQYFKQDINVKVENESISMELLKQEDIYGFKIDNMFKKFLAVQNKDLKKWAKILNMTDEQIEAIPDKIEFNETINFSDEEINGISQKYKNIINENLTDEMFSKEKEKEVTIYKLQLTKKQYNDILAKILETIKSDDVVLNRITAMYGQQNNSAKDSVIKMYQENLDEEIRDLQNISSEEASEEIIFNVYKAKNQLLQTEKIEDNTKLSISRAQNGINILYSENDGNGNETDRQEIQIMKQKDNDKLTYSINIMPQDTTKNSYIKYTVNGIASLENVEEQIEFSGNYDASLLSGNDMQSSNISNLLSEENTQSSGEDEKAAQEEEAISARLETIVANKNDENATLTLEDLTQGFSGISNFKISKDQDEENKDGFIIESKETGYIYEIDKSGELIGVSSGDDEDDAENQEQTGSKEEQSESAQEENTQKFSINYKNTKKFNTNFTIEKVDSKDIMLLNNKNAESLQQLFQKINEQMVMQMTNSNNNANSSEQTNQ